MPDRLTVNECQAARYLSADGYSTLDIGSFIGRQDATVARHVRGDCDCETPDGPVSYPTIIGVTLRQRRLMAGLTMDELAERVGVARSSVHAWEVERNTPKPEHARRLNEVLSNA